MAAGQRIPPSLQNIFKELHDDLDCSTPKSGSLVKVCTTCAT